jgi:hypothetical protein
MTDQEVFNMLADLEEYFFYKQYALNPTLDDIHDKLKFCLKAWAEYTGCKNEEA